MASACTINEANVVATMGWHAGMFPPGKTDVALSRTVGGASPTRTGWRSKRSGRPRPVSPSA